MGYGDDLHIDFEQQISELLTRLFGIIESMCIGIELNWKYIFVLLP